MSHFQECLKQQGPRAILLSVKPRFADQIIAGTKKVEFRRSWAAEPVGLAVIYSSSPTQQIIAIVDIKGTVSAIPSTVWAKCRLLGPGLERKELLEYFSGKDQAYGILLGKVTLPPKPISPTLLFKDFRPPQSYRYLSTIELRRIGKQFGLL